MAAAAGTAPKAGGRGGVRRGRGAEGRLSALFWLWGGTFLQPERTTIRRRAAFADGSAWRLSAVGAQISPRRRGALRLRAGVPAAAACRRRPLLRLASPTRTILPSRRASCLSARAASATSLRCHAWRLCCLAAHMPLHRRGAARCAGISIFLFAVCSSHKRRACYHRASSAPSEEH